LKQNYIPQYSGGEMSAKRLACSDCASFISGGQRLAQVNELSFTAGRTFVSTRRSVPSSGLPIHFGNEEGVAFNYGRLLKTHKIFGLYAELPVAIVFSDGPELPREPDSQRHWSAVRDSIGAGERFFRRLSHPWVSAGGGYGRFREASSLYFYGPNPGPTGTNTGVLQVGAGLDVWFWHRWGARFEARDFYSGAPDPEY
jgi:hypothetical protein